MKTRTIIITAVSVVGVGALSCVGYRVYRNMTTTNLSGGETPVPLDRTQRDAALRVVGSAPALNPDMVRRAKENRANRARNWTELPVTSPDAPNESMTSAQTDGPMSSGQQTTVRPNVILLR